MVVLPRLTSPSAYPGVEQKQAWIVIQTVSRRHPLLPGLVVRINYTPCVSQGLILTWKLGSGNMDKVEGQGRRNQTISVPHSPCLGSTWWDCQKFSLLLSFSDEAIRSSC